MKENVALDPVSMPALCAGSAAMRARSGPLILAMMAGQGCGLFLGLLIA